MITPAGERLDGSGARVHGFGFVQRDKGAAGERVGLCPQHGQHLRTDRLGDQVQGAYLDHAWACDARHGEKGPKI